jgi:hypothetical protein
MAGAKLTEFCCYVLKETLITTYIVFNFDILLIPQCVLHLYFLLNNGSNILP